MKYEFTGEAKTITTSEGRECTLHRIRLVKDIKNFKAGTIGGWIEGSENLYQYDDAWVADEAMVYDNALVVYDGIVADNAEVFGNATVYGKVNRSAKVYDRAMVHTLATITDNAEVFGRAVIEPTVIVNSNQKVSTRVRWRPDHD